MAEYSYAAIQIGGIIPDQTAAKALVAALLMENAVGDEEEARRELLRFITASEPAGFDADEKSGGAFEHINEAVRVIPGVYCATSYAASAGYGAGYFGIDAEGREHFASGDGGEPTIPLGQILAAANIDDLVNEARLASGADMPPLSAPLPVLAWLDTGDERGEVDDNGIPCATTDEIASLVAVMDGAGMKPGEHFNLDVDPQASRADDATWVQVWVRVPTPEEETANGEE